MLDGQRSLNTSLEQAGGYLIVRRGNPLEELERLKAECDAETSLLSRMFRHLPGNEILSFPSECLLNGVAAPRCDRQALF